MNTILAKKRGILHKLDFATKLIWITHDNYPGYGNYVVIHFMDHEELFGCDYVACRNISDLNEIKRKILNNGFKINWDEFNSAMEWLK